MDAEAELPWESYFQWQKSAYYGRVRECDDVNDLIREFSYSTSTSYVVVRSTKNFGNFELGQSNEDHLVRFEDDGRVQHGSKIESNGIPFMVIGNKLMECHQGPNHRKGSDSKNLETTYHDYKQAASKKRATGTKKKGCEAVIHLREILFFPDYKLPKDTAYWREQKSRELRRDLHSGAYTEIDMEKFIYIDLPKMDDHSKHIMGMAADIKAPIDGRIVEKVNFLVDEGVFNAKEMQRHIKVFVKELFGSANLPSIFNRRFYPSKGDIQKLIYRRRQKLLYSLVDQENLLKKVEDWKKENAEDLWFIRTSASIKRPLNEDESENEECCVKDEDQTLLMVYQSSWQKRLLERYGNELTFLDATYRTTKYALPLFFLCVQTNTGYSVVGTFVVEKEDSKSVAEAIAILKDNCPKWNTSNFMIDSSEIEAVAIKLVFPDAKILICDFHRKQAWQRWTSSLKNNVQDQEATLDMLNRVAESLTEDDFQSNLRLMKENPLWKKQPRLQDYMQKQWLANDKHKSWVWAYRNDALTIVVHTNNGVESQNKAFKYEYLAPFRVKTLSYLMTVLTQDFFLDAYRKYLANNVTMSSGWREPNQHIPREMHHRPLHLIKHMRETEMKAACISNNMVHVNGDNSFSVMSVNNDGIYNISLGNENEMPSCQCREFKRSHLLCKHFLGIFHHVPGISWDSLPDSYKNNPHFIVDTDCVDTCPLLEDTDIPYVCSSELTPDDEVETQCATKHTTLDLQRSAKQVREVLHRLNNLTYIVDSVEKLITLRHNLHELEINLVKECPSSEGLILEADIEKEKGPTRKSLKRKGAKLKELPSKRKKKIATSSIKGRKMRSKPHVLGVSSHRNLVCKGAFLTKQRENEIIKTNYRKTVKAKVVPTSSADSTSSKSAVPSSLGVGTSSKTAVPSSSGVGTSSKTAVPSSSGVGTSSKTAVPSSSGVGTSSKTAVPSSSGVGTSSKTVGTSSSALHRRLEDDFIADLKAQGLMKNSSYMVKRNANVRYYVGGEVVEGHDLQTLQGTRWLNDKIINAYLGLLQSKQNLNDSEHIYIITSYIAVIWKDNRYDYLYRKVQFSKYSWVFVPINKNDNHWILLAANIRDKTVNILDSLHGDNDRYIEHWRRYMRIRAKKVKDLDCTWEKGDLRSSRQRDGHSCGLFVLMNALAITKGILPSDLSQRCATVMREYVASQLITNAEKPPQQKTLCDMVDCKKPNREPWVKCDVCGRWLHYKCVNIKSASPGGFECPICEAQYG
uniref:Uncharacterized protein LOC111123426 n=1 Tax=Crassostrea virginica TaxID=6565 RepID=A0A8B8D0Y5_CRAVI|nr:uncharacterized protein LOC111123426 [Crassostrea virginica]